VKEKADLSKMEVCKGTIYTFQISVNSGAGTAFTPGAPGFASVFYGVCDFQSLVFCVMFCRSLFFLFVLFILAIVFSILKIIKIYNGNEIKTNELNFNFYYSVNRIIDKRYLISQIIV
jgi:hypothetical protein